MPIKIFHTSDWHLGKKLYKTSRITEQKIFLNWLLDRIKREQIDIIIIAGDIFDSPIPPTEALALYFSFLDQLLTTTSCNAYIIAGNHDSGKFLEAPKTILPQDRIHIVGEISSTLSRRFKKNETDGVDLVLLPYFRSYEILNIADSQADENHSKILETLNTILKKSLPKKKVYPQILIAHHLFGTFFSEGSEQSLSLSGLESLPLEHIAKDFDYLALGHIHKPQEISSHIVYCGSPIPFRFSEKQTKHLYMIEVSGDTVDYRKIKIPQSRIMESLTCNEQNYISKIEMFRDTIPHDGPNALLEVKIRLSAPHNSVIDHIRDLVKNHNIELLAVHTILPTSKEQVDDVVIAEYGFDLLEQFKKYHQIKNPEIKDVPTPLLEAFQELLDEINSDGSK